MNTADLIRRGAGLLPVSVSDDQQAQLARFLDLIARWNRVHNLTAIRDPADMVVQHIFDSLVIAPFVTGGRVIDVGTGAGLPGIPLAICQPQKAFTLLDANQKKVSFLMQAKIELGLENIEPVHHRVEEFKGEYDHVLCRAFADLAKIIQQTRHLLGKAGTILAMKSQAPEQTSFDGMTVINVTALKVPMLDAERCLVEVRAQ